MSNQQPHPGNPVDACIAALFEQPELIESHQLHSDPLMPAEIKEQAELQGLATVWMLRSLADRYGNGIASCMQFRQMLKSEIAYIGRAVSNTNPARLILNLIESARDTHQLTLLVGYIGDIASAVGSGDSGVAAQAYAARLMASSDTPLTLTPSSVAGRPELLIISEAFHQLMLNVQPELDLGKKLA